MDVECFQDQVDYFQELSDCDLFASRLNKQVATYVSWLPDHGVTAVDAFSVIWSTGLMYAFPPFSLVGLTLQKIEADIADVIPIGFYWPTQSWHAKLLRLLAQQPVLLPHDNKLLTLPFNRQRRHPLGRKLNLMTCYMSGKVSKHRGFQEKAQDIILSEAGEPVPENSLLVTWRSDPISVPTRAMIDFTRL